MSKKGDAMATSESDLQTGSQSEDSYDEDSYERSGKSEVQLKRQSSKQKILQKT